MTTVSVSISDAAVDLAFDATGMDTNDIQQCMRKTIARIGVATPTNDGNIRVLLTQNMTVYVNPETCEARCTVPVGLVEIELRQTSDGAPLTVSGTTTDPQYQALTDFLIDAAREYIES